MFNLAFQSVGKEDCKSEGERDVGWCKAFYFPILSKFCVLPNTDILTVTNTNGRLIMGGKTLRETGRPRVLHGKGRYRRVKNHICLFLPGTKTTLARA